MLAAHERWSEHTRQLLPLHDGDNVFIQNQSKTGKAAKKWDKVGVIIDDRKAHIDQYLVRMLGSGRITVRNRVYLRKYWNKDDMQKAPASMVRNGPDKYCPDRLDPSQVGWEQDIPPTTNQQPPARELPATPQVH